MGNFKNAPAKQKRVQMSACTKKYAQKLTKKTANLVYEGEEPLTAS